MTNRPILSLLFVFLTLTVFGQERGFIDYNLTVKDTAMTVEFFEKGGEVAEPIPNLDTLDNFIRKNIYYSAAALTDKIEGNIELLFTIDTLGAIKNIKLKKGLRKDLDEIAIKTVSEMPPWTPTILQGKPINLTFLMEIKYELKQ